MGKRRKKELYHAYTDGSCFMSEGLMGMGWIISRETNGKYRPGLKRLLYKGKPSSSLAEIYAVATALRKVEEGSTVVVHTDDLSLCNLLNNGNFYDQIEKAKKPAQRLALVSLFESVNTHASITAVHEKQASSDHLTRAHHMSRAACQLNSASDLSNSLKK
jgi:ribonuclease HI